MTRSVAACNKREPGSGCAALTGSHRMHAILGTSDHCIATHPSDLAVPLIALDAVVRIQGGEQRRVVPLMEFYRAPGDTPHVENVLEHGELITAVEMPLLPAANARSHYLKVRDRASYEFALTSAAVALRTENGSVTWSRVAMGGVGTMPWRALRRRTGAARRPGGHRDASGRPPRPRWRARTPCRTTPSRWNSAQRTVVRALQTVSGVES